MPKTPIDYQKSIIYKICCKDVSITDCYVGSTTNLSRRKPQHKTCCNNERGKKYHLNVYQFIRDHGGWENWSMVVVEESPCESKNQLHTRERYHMELLNSTLNSSIPTRTCKEYQRNYREDNAEKVKAYFKAHKSEKIPCPHCNKILSRCSMTGHIRTQHTE